MFGNPGSGKTTAAIEIAKLTHAVHLSSDEMRLKMFVKPTFTMKEHAKLYNELDRLTEQLLKDGKDVIYDANLNRYKHRHDKYVICTKTKARSILLWVQTEKEIARRRALDTSRLRLWPENETPEHMFKRISDLIELPSPDEPYIVLDGTKITSAYIKSKLNLHD